MPGEPYTPTVLPLRPYLNDDGDIEWKQQHIELPVWAGMVCARLFAPLFLTDLFP